MKRVYCQACWLFSHKNASPGTSNALQNPWGTTGLKEWRHLSQRIGGHKSFAHNSEACVVYEQ